MRWSTTRAAFLIAVGVWAAAGGYGCNDDETCASGETCAGTPEPTPDPTEPVKRGYWVTGLEVAGEGEGLDLNGDGTVDNGLPAMLEVLSQVVSTAVEQALCEETECTGDQADLLEQAQQFIETAFSLSTLSWALSNPIETGEATYVTILEGDSLLDPVSFTWYLSKTPESDTSRCVMTGELDDGAGRFGPCSLHVVTDSYGSEDAGIEFSLDLVFSDAQMEIASFTWSGFSFTGGGVITSDVMLSVIEQVILLMNDVMDAGIPVEVAMHAMESVLPTYADFDSDGDGENDAFSLAVFGETASSPTP